MRNFLKILAFLFVFSANALADDIVLGYTDGTIDRTKVFHLGTTKQQGQAIRLSHEKLQALRGCRITALQAAFGSRMTLDNRVRFFLATELGGEPLLTFEGTIEKALKNLSFPLPEAYVVTGDEPALYIGYEAETLAASYNLLSSDFKNELPGCNFALSDGTWVDVCGTKTGAANLRIVLDRDPAFADIIVCGAKFEGYYQCGKASAFPFRVVNFGTRPIESFDVVFTLGDREERYAYAATALGQGEGMDIALPEAVCTEEGEVALRIAIEEVNGGSGAAEADDSDNALSASLFCYPEEMERCVLVESFTGQACSQCPSGHTVLENFLEKQATPSVVVSHHAGYLPDAFTMEEDIDCLFFYDGTSTYAPAVMFNRTACPQVSVAPVMDISVTKMQPTLEYALNREPYASISLQTSFDPLTQQCSLRAGFLPHRALPDGRAVVGFLLVQDSIPAYQTNGGASYMHRHVCRGCLTESSWGEEVVLTPGETLEWQTEFTLPESIRSSYWTAERLEGSQYENAESLLNHAVVPQNMSIVAYMAECGSASNTSRRILNCQSVRLGESYTQRGFTAGIGLPTLAAEAERLEVEVRDGRISVVGVAPEQIGIFDLQGRHYAPESVLQHGIYVVRALLGGRVLSSLVRV